jgi:hypothetical protein
VCESYSCKNCYGSGLNSCRACNGIAAVRCSVCMGRKQVTCNFQNRDQDERMPPVPNLSQIVQFWRLQCLACFFDVHALSKATRVFCEHTSDSLIATASYGNVGVKISFWMHFITDSGMAKYHTVDLSKSRTRWPCVMVTFCLYASIRRSFENTEFWDSLRCVWWEFHILLFAFDNTDRVVWNRLILWMTCCFNPLFQNHVLILYLDASFTCAWSVTYYNIILFLLKFIFRLLVIASRLEDTTTRLRRALDNLLPQRSCKRVDFACVWRSSYFEKVISTIARSTPFESWQLL